MRWYVRLVSSVVLAGSAQAATVYWMQGVGETLVGAASTAKAVIHLPAGDVTLSYVGEVDNPNELGAPGPDWLPASTFSGGVVDNPPPFGNKLVLDGGPLTKVDTVTFSRPVVNPIIAIFSLGEESITSKIVFPKTYSLSLQSGGPSNWYGGQSVVVKGSVVYGSEGNGTIQLNGTFRQIQFVLPVYEYSSSVTVGLTQ